MAKEKKLKEKRTVKPKNKKKVIILVSIISVILVIGLSLSLVLYFNFKNKDYSVDEMEVLKVLSGADSAVAAKQTVENVVQIINKIDDENTIYGTGFFDKSGYLVTNSHVVDIKGDITIRYNNGKMSKAKIYSNDILSDLAILTVEENNVKALPIGTTMKLEVTNEVYSVGYQLNLEGEASVTKGILSAKRSASGIEFLQTDAAVNSGGSGGPVINDKGEVLGIVTLASDNATLSFAISSDTLSLYIDKLINNKEVNYITEKRDSNALSVVLKEVNYHEEDIYGENRYFEHKDNDDKKDDNKNNDKHIYTDTPVVSTKSGDNTLKSLSIMNYGINFSSNNTYYKISVSTGITSLNINAQPNDSKAKVSISGNDGFVQGTNRVSIVVVAENGARREYNIDVVVPQTKLDRATKIIVGLNTIYSSSHGQNVFDLFWDYADRDNIRVYGNGDLDILSKIYVDVYTGWSENDNSVTSDGKEMRLVKSYSYNPTINQTHVYIPLGDVRAVLTDEDYEGGVYAGADLTFKLRLVTKEQGTFTGRTPWGLNK